MASSTLPPLWNVPYRQNPFFTGREETLKHLHRALQADGSVALSHPVGISGLGGIGKTQTALEFAYRYHMDYDAVFWVRANSTATLFSSFVALAHLLGLPERNEQDQHLIVDAVLRWLRLHSGWLLVFDSMDDPSVAEPFLPKAGQGHLLLTTRAHALGGIAQCLEVHRMEPDTGGLLLLRRANILPLRASLDMAGSDDCEAACEISRELDGLPLALDQAGAYIKERPCPLGQYLTLYQTRRQELLQARGKFDQDYPAPVATTWSLSFEKVSQINPAAAQLLNLCAFLAPDPVPEEIITEGASHLGPVLRPVAADSVQLDLACKEVLRFSLFHRGGDMRTLTMHRLVQAVLKDRMDEQNKMQWAKRTVLAVNAAYPSGEYQTWLQCERVLPHALVSAELIEQYRLTLPEAARLLNQTGVYLREHARYQEAEPPLQRSLAICEQQLGPNHPNTATSLNNLASLYNDQGKYGQAEPLWERALAICEQQLEPNHPDTATNLNNLAMLYFTQGKYTQAESFLERTLAICERQLGPDHPDTAQSLDNLAMLYASQGKYAQAEALYQQALSIWEQVGPQNPDTATCLNNLASLYQAQGRYEQAEPLLERALAIWEQQLGPEHPNTASGLNSLAILYQTQGRYKQAEPLYQRARDIWMQQVGPQHPNTADSLINLADLYKTQGRYEQAEPLLQQALTICEQQLGPEHLRVATVLNNLALLYANQGKYAQAEPLYKRALAIREQQLGPQNPDTTISLNNLAALYYVQGKYEQAEPLYQQALAIREHQLESRHLDTVLCPSQEVGEVRSVAATQHAIVDLLVQQGRVQEAQTLYEQALRTTQELGDRRGVAMTQTALANLLVQRSKNNRLSTHKRQKGSSRVGYLFSKLFRRHLS